MHSAKVRAYGFWRCDIRSSASLDFNSEKVPAIIMSVRQISMGVNMSPADEFYRTGDWRFPWKRWRGRGHYRKPSSARTCLESRLQGHALSTRTVFPVPSNRILIFYRTQRGNSLFASDAAKPSIRQQEGEELLAGEVQALI